MTAIDTQFKEIRDRLDALDGVNFLLAITPAGEHEAMVHSAIKVAGDHETLRLVIEALDTAANISQKYKSHTIAESLREICKTIRSNAGFGESEALQ